MKNIPINLTLAVLLASATLTGCVTQTPQMDDKFGEAVNSAKALQTINPDASLNSESPDGMGGKAAAAVMNRYHDSYKNPPVPIDVFTIGVGSNSGSSGSGK